MSKAPLAIFAFVLIAIAGFFFVFSQKNVTPLATSNQVPTASPSQAIPTQIELGAGGSSLTDIGNTFTILYPDDYSLDTTDALHPRIYKRGDSQRPQSELSDGAMMVFEVIDLNGKNLESIVDTRIKEATADGTAKIVKDKEPFTQNKYQGFTYKLQGLGESTNVILQKDASSPHAVLITYMVSDPQKKGYQEQIDTILSSLQILK